MGFINCPDCECLCKKEKEVNGIIGICLKFPPTSSAVVIPTQNQSLSLANKHKGVSLQINSLTTYPEVKANGGCWIGVRHAS